MCLLVFLLMAGDKHGNVRAREAKSTLRSKDESGWRSRLYGFPSSWNIPDIDDDSSVASAASSPKRGSTVDRNGFPSDYSDSNSVDGSPRSLDLSRFTDNFHDYEFMPSIDNKSNNSDFFAATLRSVVNAPSNVASLLHAPVKLLPGLGNTVLNLFPGRDMTKSSVNFGTDPTKENTLVEDDGVFVNPDAHSMGSSTATIINTSEVQKRGKLYTLGGRKLNEKSPKVKEREMNMTGYYLYYYDMYNQKQEFSLRDCSIEKLVVRASSGDVAGKKFYALLLEQGSEQITVGSQIEAVCDDWFNAISEVVMMIRREEIENDGEEEEELRHKGLPSFVEQSFLNPQLPHSVRESLDTISNVRKRIIPFQPRRSNSARMGTRRSSLKAKVNDDPIMSPLHGVDAMAKTGGD